MVTSVMAFAMLGANCAQQQLSLNFAWCGEEECLWPSAGLLLGLCGTNWWCAFISALCVGCVWGHQWCVPVLVGGLEMLAGCVLCCHLMVSAVLGGVVQQWWEWFPNQGSLWTNEGLPKQLVSCLLCPTNAGVVLLGGHVCYGQPALLRNLPTLVWEGPL